MGAAAFFFGAVAFFWAGGLATRPAVVFLTRGFEVLALGAGFLAVLVFFAGWREAGSDVGMKWFVGTVIPEAPRVWATI